MSKSGSTRADYTNILRELCVTSRVRGYLCGCIGDFVWLFVSGDCNDQIRAEGYKLYPFPDVIHWNEGLPVCSECKMPKFTLGTPEKGVPTEKLTMPQQNRLKSRPPPKKSISCRNCDKFFVTHTLKDPLFCFHCLLRLPALFKDLLIT